jgi:hypothetical protein
MLPASSFLAVASGVVMLKKTPGRAAALATKRLTKDTWHTFLPTHVLDQVARAACVSGEHRSSVRYGIDDMASLLCLSCEHSGTRDDEYRRVQSQLRGLARTAEEFANRIQGLDDAARVIAQTATSYFFENSASPRHKRCVEDVASRLERCELLARGLAINLRERDRISSIYRREPHRRAPHRPAGSVKYPALHLLVRELFRWLVEHGHGRLTLFAGVDDYTPRGTLPAVVEILRPHLAGIPVRLSYKMLRRIRALTPEAPKRASLQKSACFQRGQKAPKH